MKDAMNQVSGAPDKKDPDVVVENGHGNCAGCGRCLGTVVQGRNLLAGEIILINRTPIRCRVCKTKNIWKPLR